MIQMKHDPNSSNGLTLNHQVFQDFIYASAGSSGLSHPRISPQSINMRKPDDK